MTREVAKQVVATELIGSDLSAFEQYAHDGEAFEGEEFWQGFESTSELIDDFRLFVTVGDGALVAC